MIGKVLWVVFPDFNDFPEIRSATSEGNRPPGGNKPPGNNLKKRAIGVEILITSPAIPKNMECLE